MAISASAAEAGQGGAASQIHPLQHSWSLWYDNKKKEKALSSAKGPQGEAEYEDHLVPVDTVSSVEAFWVILSQIRKPASLEMSANYHFFKKGVKPMWEDEANRNGGRWNFTLTTKEDLYRLDTIWEELLMAMIGEYIDEGIPGNHIMGAVVGKRRNMVKLAVWTRDCNATEALNLIRDKLISILKLDPTGTQMQYIAHSASSGAPSGH